MEMSFTIVILGIALMLPHAGTSVSNFKLRYLFALVNDVGCHLGLVNVIAVTLADGPHFEASRASLWGKQSERDWG